MGAQLCFLQASEVCKQTEMMAHLATCNLSAHRSNKTTPCPPVAFILAGKNPRFNIKMGVLISKELNTGLGI